MMMIRRRKVVLMLRKIDMCRVQFFYYAKCLFMRLRFLLRLLVSSDIIIIIIARIARGRVIIIVDLAKKEKRRRGRRGLLGLYCDPPQS